MCISLRVFYTQFAIQKVKLQSITFILCSLFALSITRSARLYTHDFANHIPLYQTVLKNLIVYSHSTINAFSNSNIQLLNISCSL